MLRNHTPKRRTLTLWCIISTEFYSQNVGSLYPIQNFISKCTFLYPAPKGFTETLQLTYIFPNCWQNTSNTNIYFVRVSCIYILVLDISYQQLGEMCQLEGFCAPRNLVTFGNIYICIGYMLPTFGEYTSVEFIHCSRAKLRKVKECTFCIIHIYIYLYWIYAAKIWRSYVSRIYTLLQGQTVRGPISRPEKSEQLGPQTVRPWSNV